jgi:hypothetical protein
MLIARDMYDMSLVDGQWNEMGWRMTEDDDGAGVVGDGMGWEGHHHCQRAVGNRRGDERRERDEMDERVKNAG